MKPIVFISSVSEGYQHIRKAAGEAVSKAGGKPIGFEDFPALDKSSRNACLDGVRNCDVFVGILGAHYGWITPSGLSATEEEFQEALGSGKRRLIFVEEVDQREEEQEAFLKRAGDYQSGRFWKKFKSHEDLKKNLETSLKEVFDSLMKELPESQMKERLKKEVFEPLPYDYSQAWLITAAILDCQTSLADETSFNEERFAKDVFRIGQDGEPSVFEIESSKTKALKEDHWLLEQTEKEHWREGLRLSTVRVYLDTCVVVGMNVTGREPESDHYGLQGLYIYPDTVQEVANGQLSFLSRFYQRLDPHHRWDRIALMSTIHNVGFRNFTRPKAEQSSHPMSMRSGKGPFIAFDMPKILERNQLVQPDYSRAIKGAFERSLRN